MVLSAPRVSKRRSHGAATSKLRVHANREHRDGPSIAVECGIRDVLIVEAQVCVVQHREGIVRLEDLLRARMGKFTVAHQDAEPSGVQIALAVGGYAVEYPCK